MPAPPHVSPGPAGRPAFQGPQPFGRYELLVEMGYGGMATLYLARMSGPSNFEKLLAIKKIHEQLVAEPQMVAMFLDEARISARIQHPNVVQIFEFDEVAGAHYIAMEYVHGHDFAALLQAVGQHPECAYRWSHAARVVADAAAGLHAAHELTTADGRSLNLVHRDVSPQNLLLSYQGYVKVADFGIATAVDKLSQTLAGTVKGKVAYMSPEQVRGGAVDRRTDIFALGIVLWEAVTLQRLFREPTDVATMKRVAEADVPRPRSIARDLPVTVERVIMKALARNPDERYQTAAELRRALEKAMSSAGELLGSSAIEDLMAELFANYKIKKDLEIKQAAQATAVDNPSLIMAALKEAGDTGQQAALQPTAAAVPSAMVTESGQPTPSAPGGISPDGRRGPAPSGPQPLAAEAARISSGGMPAVKTPSGAGGPFGQAAGEVAARSKDSARSTRSTLTLVLAVCAVLLFAAVLVVLLTRGPGGGTAPARSSAAMKPEAPKANVELTFFVTPKDAHLRIDGKEHAEGRGVFKRVVTVKRTEKPLQVRVTAEGYTGRETTVIPVKDQLVTISLIKDVDRPRPEMAPAMDPSMAPAPAARKRGRHRRRRRPRHRSRRSAMRGGGAPADVL